MPTVTRLLQDHVTLTCECIDRMYLNGYVPTLQTPRHLVRFYSDHRDQPIASPVLCGRHTASFVQAVETFAARHHIPMVHFPKHARKEAIARKYFARYRGPEGVVLIGVAQERMRGFRATKIATGQFSWTRQPVCVKHYYFYLLDRDFGPAFIKVGTYLPFPIKVWLNGHEWVKRQLAHKQIPYRSLNNGILSVGDPARCQALCDALSADHVEAFFCKWLGRLPHPFTAADRRAGYRYQLSIIQLEVSATHVFQRPLQGRQFFEEVLREHLDLGRPEQVQLVFGRKVIRTTPGPFRTRLITHDVDPSLYIFYKHSKLKQYLKEGKALRTELTINDPWDFHVRKSLRHLGYLRALGQHITRRLLASERVSQDCASSEALFHQVILPSTHDGLRAPGLRFGEPRVMALLSALCAFLHLVDGFANRDLRGRVAPLLTSQPETYTAASMTYDLRRLRRKGFIQRLPDRNRYVVTAKGRRIALFFSKTYTRILRPGLGACDPTLPTETPTPLAHAFHQLDHTITTLVQEAHLIAS